MPPTQVGHAGSAGVAGQAAQLGIKQSVKGLGAMTAYVGRRRGANQAARMRDWTTILLGLLCALVVLSIPLGLLAARG